MVNNLFLKLTEHEHPVGCYITIPPGLELNSTYGPLHTHLLLIEEDHFDGMRQVAKANEQLFQHSKFGAAFLALP